MPAGAFRADDCWALHDTFSMKFALIAHSPLADLSAQTIEAKSLGYDGMEINGLPTDVQSLRQSLIDAGLDICCLATSVTYSHPNRMRATDELKRSIAMAAELNAPLVKLPSEQGRAINSIEFGDWLLPQGDLAAEAGICLILENGHTWPTARSLWSLLDRMNHPSIACCWNLSNAIQAGESPSVSVPVLNSRIRYAQVDHVETESLPPDLPLQKHTPVERLLKRLRGIGYTGYIATGGCDSFELSSNTLAKLRQWDQRLKISDAEAAARPS